MKIEKNKVVKLICELKDAENKDNILDSFTKEEPLCFLTGASNIFEEFENNLYGLSKGDDFDFTLLPVNAFGDYDDEALIEIPYDNIMENNKNKGDLEIGHFIKVLDDNNEEMYGEVTNIDLDNNIVNIDFNHPFAGLNVNFTGTIIDVRDASENEIKQGFAN